MTQPAPRQSAVATAPESTATPITPSHPHLGARFRAAARAYPHAIALSHGRWQLSYARLDALSDQLAARLRRLGVRAEVPVGLLVPRGPAVPIGILGIVKAGGYYVPLDPSHPPRRRAFVLRDAGVRHLLCTRDLHPAGAGTGPTRAEEESAPDIEHILALDQPEIDFAGPAITPASTEQSDPAPYHLAYAIYTSGSTGQPKGVGIEHWQVETLLRASEPLDPEHWDGDTERNFDFGPQDVWALFHSFAFDFSVWEMWGALGYGGRLVMVPAATARNTAEFHRLLQEQGVSVLNQTPSAFSQLQACDARDSTNGTRRTLPRLRWVLFAGEALDLGSLRPWFDRYGDERPRMINMFGITETTVHITYRRLRRRDTGDAGPDAAPVPSWIGLPMRHLDALLLPVGSEEGEVGIGGAGLSRGYLGRPALTADRFVPHPASTRPGARLYRTGDLARACFDDQGEVVDLQYLGRLDFQVQLRGFRVELGEIEAALRRHPDVADASVLALDAGGDTRLVAFLVRRTPLPSGLLPSAHDAADLLEAAVDADDLRAQLATQVPAYMVPSAFLFLPRLPLTVNGKLDRRALEAHWRRQTPARPVSTPPATELQKQLAALWSEHLGVDDIGLEDDFFLLGGHSLIATRLVHSVRRALGVDYGYRDLFEAPTVESAAARLSKKRPAGPIDGAQPDSTQPAPGAPQTQSVVRRGSFPASFAQERLWFLEQAQEEANVCTFTLRLLGVLDTSRLLRGLRQLMQRHEALRTGFRVQGGKLRQVIQASVTLPVPIVDLGAMDTETKEALARRLELSDRERGCDLETAPLVRAHLLRLDDQHHILLLSLHHLIFDGWSFNVLVRELGQLYAAGPDGPERVAQLLPPAPQHVDFSLRQQERLEQGGYQPALRFWRQYLGPRPKLAMLPTDRRLDRSGQSLLTKRAFVLDEEATAALRRLGGERQSTLFMVLFAAFQVLLLRRDPANRNAVVLSIIAGREAAETHGLVGFLVNTLALRVVPAEASDFEGLLERTRQAVLDAQAHQDVPFEVVQRHLGLDAATPEGGPGHVTGDRAPTLFVLQNIPFGRWATPELRLKVREVEQGARDGKLGLIFFIYDLGERLSIEIAYNRAAFDDSRIENLLLDYTTICRQAADMPRAQLEELRQQTSAATPPARQPDQPATAASPEAPTSPATPPRRASRLSDRQRALIARRLGKEKPA